MIVVVVGKRKGEPAEMILEERVVEKIRGPLKNLRTTKKTTIAPLQHHRDRSFQQHLRLVAVGGWTVEEVDQKQTASTLVWD